MRLSTTLGLCLGLMVFNTACDPVAENRLFREGIGTDLTRLDIAEVTRAQDVYLGYLCAQAGLSVVKTVDGSVRCNAEGPVSRNWSLIVQAGMNDIDQRCDAYLAWLDDRRRSRAPILSQINALQTSTTAVLRFTGISPTPISVAGEAFGLASSTFMNLNSRLILEVNHSTVQSIVINRRGEFRESTDDVTIDNRPAAIHVLRSYLNICLPFTIEMDINTTVTAFQFGGPDALVNRSVPNSPDTARSSVAAVAAVAPRQAIASPSRPLSPANESFAKIIENYVPAVHTQSYVRRIQDALCSPPNEIGKPGVVTQALIRVLEATYRRSTGERKNGKLDADEIAEVLSQGSCQNSVGRNYFERRTFTDDETGARALAAIVTGLRKFKAGESLPPNPSLDDVRAAISSMPLPLAQAAAA
jgi:hypothetical protein